MTSQTDLPVHEREEAEDLARVGERDGDMVYKGNNEWVNEPVATMTPAGVDTALFPILEKLACAEHHQKQNAQTIERYGEDSPSVRNIVASRDRIAEELAELSKQARPYEEEFERRGWNRYILVAGKRGHLHRESCSTLTPGRTLVGLVPEASGLSPKEVVKQFSYTACTHCFPGAPVEPKLTPQQEGFCEHSGEYVPDDKLPDNWTSLYVSPRVKCECGWRGAVTKGGKFKKHKPGDNR